MDKEEKSIPNYEKKCRGCSKLYFRPPADGIRAMSQDTGLCGACEEQAELKNRIAIFQIAHNSMVAIIIGTCRITNLPKDAIIIAMVASIDYDGFLFKVQSKEFDIHKENEQIKMIPIEFELTEDLQKKIDQLEENYYDIMNTPDDPMEA